MNGETAKKRTSAKRVIGVVLAFLIVIAECGLLMAYYMGELGQLHPLKEAKDGDVKVACVGDSITFGTFVFGWPEAAYPSVLGNMLGEGYTVNNYGYPGRCAQSDADRPYVKEELYRKALDFDADVVIIMFGSNDSKNADWKGEEHFIAEYSALIESFLARPSIKEMYIMAPPPAWEFFGKVRYNINSDRVKNEINRSARTLADKYDLGFIDLYEVFDGKRELFADGVHPTDKGAKLLAETVYSAVFDKK